MKNENGFKLYVVAWSLHCRKAEALLRKAEISFEKIILHEEGLKWDLFAATPRDLGIHHLPALEENGNLYEGLSTIKKVIKDRQKLYGGRD